MSDLLLWRQSLHEQSHGESFMALFANSRLLDSYDGETISEIAYQDTKHFLLTRDFLNAPERFFKHLFES